MKGQIDSWEIRIHYYDDDDFEHRCPYEYYRVLNIGESDAVIKNGELEGFSIDGLYISLDQMGREIPRSAIPKELMDKLSERRFVEGLILVKKGSPGKED